MNMTCVPVFGTYYVFLLTMFLIKLLFLFIPHQSLMMRESSPQITMRKDALLKNAVFASPHDSLETTRLDEDSERSSVVDDRISPTLALQVLAITWQRDMWLHVAYGV